MTDEIKLLDVVALMRDMPERGLHKGQVGTVVEEVGPSTLVVEFSDNKGRTYATASIRASELIVLHYEPVERGA